MAKIIFRFETKEKMIGSIREEKMRKGERNDGHERKK